MKIEHQQTGRSGSFFIREQGKNLALLNYEMVDDKVLGIIHTEVDPIQQNKHIGHQLVEAAVIFARDNKLKIKPMCSFAESVFKTEFKDMLANV